MDERRMSDKERKIAEKGGREKRKETREGGERERENTYILHLCSYFQLLGRN